MPFHFHQAKDKLTDPLLMDWLLNRLHETQGGALSQNVPAPESWIDADTLRDWLESEDEGMIARLFSNLPAECFAGLEESIAGHWLECGGRLAQQSAVVLARIAPEVAWACFTQDLGDSTWDIDSKLGIVRSLHLLPKEGSRISSPRRSPPSSRPRSCARRLPMAALPWPASWVISAG